MTYFTMSSASLFYIVEPIVQQIVSDIIITITKDPSLNEIRDKLYKDLSTLTGKSHFFFDTDITNLIKHVCSDKDHFTKHGHIFLDAIEPWVQSTNTYWCSQRLNPVLVILKNIIYTDEVVSIVHLQSQENNYAIRCSVSNN